MRVLVIGLFYLLVLQLHAQTFFGDVPTNKGFTYLKLEVKSDSVYVSIPYVSQQKWGYAASLKPSEKFVIQFGFETWNLECRGVEPVRLFIQLATAEHEITLMKQVTVKQSLSSYIGNYTDKQGRTALVYERYGYLHLMSPYMEQTVSLKPIANNKFWSTSGEQSFFADFKQDKYQTLAITQRDGTVFQLHRNIEIQVVDVWIPVNQDSLFGQLYIPEKPGKKPACLLLPGGGGRSQIDNSAYEARLFAAHGMVALVFDKAGAGKSKGTGNFEQFTFQEKVQRYIQVFNFLSEHSEVDKQRVGIHGPSEGGRLSLMMVMDPKINPAFVNATAAPIMDMKNGQLYAGVQYHRNLGVSEEDVLKASVAWNQYYTGIIAGKLDSSQFENIRALQAVNGRMFLPPVNTQLPLSPKKEDLVDEQVFLGAGNIACPIFLQYGENDERVHPTKSVQNFMAYTTENQDVTVKMYPRGNHSFMTPELQICQGYAFDKIKWLRSIGTLPKLGG